MATPQPSQVTVEVVTALAGTHQGRLPRYLFVRRANPRIPQSSKDSEALKVQIRTVSVVDRHIMVPSVHLEQTENHVMVGLWHVLLNRTVDAGLRPAMRLPNSSRSVRPVTPLG